MASSDMQKYLAGGFVVTITFLMATGFLFGPAASFAASISGSGGNDNGNNQAQPQLPGENVVSGSYNLTLREQAALGYRNDVVFVTIMEPENGSVDIDRASLVSEFNDRVYISTVKGEDSTIAASFGYNEFPKAVAVSGDARQGRLAPDVQEAEPTRDGLSSGICSTLNNWGSLAAKCQLR